MNLSQSAQDTLAFSPGSRPENIAGMHRFKHQAMATIFEIYLLHENKSYAEQAAQAAFIELDRLEQELSRYITNSDISRINAMKKQDTITIGPDTLNCLLQCSDLYQSTKGAFDISAGKVFTLWKEGETPGAEQLARALMFTGLPWLQIDPDNFRLTLMTENIDLDLGGFGKGYALDRMELILKEWEIKSGFMHSGRSTVLVFGEPVQPDGWTFSIHHPQHPEQALQTIHLKDGALSGSGMQKGRHIIDPRSGRVVQRYIASWSIAPSAGLADGLSTAMMVMDREQLPQLQYAFPECSGMVLAADDESIIHFGNWAGTG